MDNPFDNPTIQDAATTIINVKAMPISSWNRAKEAASKQSQTMAEWLSRAINQLADREAGNRETVPGKGAGNPIGNPTTQAPDLSPADLESLVRAMTLASQSAGIEVPKTAARHVLAVGAQHLRAARGLPALNTRKRAAPMIAGPDAKDIPD